MDILIGVEVDTLIGAEVDTLVGVGTLAGVEGGAAALGSLKLKSQNTIW